MNKKKWSCPNCTYESGRWSNMNRHIASKHNSGAPELNPEYGSVQQLRYTERNETVKPVAKNKISSNTFADNYQFVDRRLKIMKDVMDALELPEGQMKNLIMTDLLLQVKNLDTLDFLRNLPLAYFIRQMATFQPTLNYSSLHSPAGSSNELTIDKPANLLKSRVASVANAYQNGWQDIRFGKITDEKLEAALSKFSKFGKEREKSNKMKGPQI